MQATNRPKKNHLLKTQFSGKHKSPKPRANDPEAADALPSREAFSQRECDLDDRSKYIGRTVRRWLKSHVGRPWNKILPEIHAKFGGDSSQVIDAVETRSYRDAENQVVVPTMFGPKLLGDCWFELYVTPEGLLAHLPRKKYKYVAKPTVLLHDGQLWFRLNGLIFKAPLDQSEPGEGMEIRPIRAALRNPYRVIYKQPTGPAKRGWVPGENRTIAGTHIRQASAKEIRALGNLLPIKEIDSY